MRQIYNFLREFKHQFFFTAFGFSATCKQQPSCSAYTTAQIKKNGTIIGLVQGLWRVIHCHQ